MFYPCFFCRALRPPDSDMGLFNPEFDQSTEVGAGPVVDDEQQQMVGVG
jgi:hypothetical protein